MTDHAPQRLDPETKHLAEGEAALVLVESLLLMLIEKGLLTPDEVAEMVEGAVLTKRVIASEEERPRLSQVAAGLLTKVANSVRAAPPGSGGQGSPG